MKLWTVTLCHTRPEVIESGLDAYARTAGLVTEHILVDHLYPIEFWHTRNKILAIAEKRGLKVISPYKNTGGHGGFSWAISQLPLQDDDIVIGYDPDSFPVTIGWDAAAVNALLENPKLAAVHLMHNHILNRGWRIDPNGIATLPHPEMFNVTIWRASFLKAVGGLKAGFRYYGQVEVPMAAEAARLGLHMGYLYNYREDCNPAQHDQAYNNWKAAHIAGDPRNFDEYVK